MTPVEYIDSIPEHLRRRLGRTVRKIVDDHLRYYDGSGEGDARAKLDDLANRLDPEHSGCTSDADELGCNQ